MKIETWWYAIGISGTLLLSGCGGDSSAPTAMGSPQNQPLNTAQVLAIAQAPTETGDPMRVGPGAVMVAGSEDDTSDPWPVGA